MESCAAEQYPQLARLERCGAVTRVAIRPHSVLVLRVDGDSGDRTDRLPAGAKLGRPLRIGERNLAPLNGIDEHAPVLGEAPGEAVRLAILPDVLDAPTGGEHPPPALRLPE